MTDDVGVPLLARINGDREVPCQPCICASCKNEFFFPALSAEWMPNFCPYCGIKFTWQATNGVPAPCLPAAVPSRTERWYTADKICRDIWDGDIWWYDNGRQIFPVNIAWSPTSESFFTTIGQWGWNQTQDVREMRGRWMPCIHPAPDKQFREASD